MVKVIGQELHKLGWIEMEHNNSVGFLTVREKEILSYLAKGLTSDQIASQLSLSKHTVDTHRRKMLKKMRCKNTAELLGAAGRTNQL